MATTDEAPPSYDDAGAAPPQMQAAPVQMQQQMGQPMPMGAQYAVAQPQPMGAQFAQPMGAQYVQQPMGAQFAQPMGAQYAQPQQQFAQPQPVGVQLATNSAVASASNSSNQSTKDDDDDLEALGIPCVVRPTMYQMIQCHKRFKRCPMVNRRGRATNPCRPCCFCALPLLAFIMLMIYTGTELAFADRYSESHTCTVSRVNETDTQCSADYSQYEYVIDVSKCSSDALIRGDCFADNSTPVPKPEYETGDEYKCRTGENCSNYPPQEEDRIEAAGEGGLIGLLISIPVFLLLIYMCVVYNMAKHHKKIPGECCGVC